MGHQAQESGKPEVKQDVPNDLKHFVACKIVSTLKSIIIVDIVPAKKKKKKNKWHLSAEGEMKAKQQQLQFFYK